MENIVNRINELEARNNLLEQEINIVKKQRDFLKEMIEWMVEAHGNSETTEYTIGEKPWKLKDYVSETLKEDYEDIDYRKSK